MSALRPITQVAEELGLKPHEVLPWGRHQAKLALDERDTSSPQGRLVLMTAINPTPAGEGKTTTAVALAMGMRRRGHRPLVCVREPSLGPVFGLKGGGTGGGKATLEPASSINLHFTGDLHAITSAHNLLSALVDNALHWRSPSAPDPRQVRWPRALDMNDRSLRQVVTGLGHGNGQPREASFDITAASEVMAILSLATSFEDLERRLGEIVVGTKATGEIVQAKQLGAGAAMTALLMDALMPNLVQTAEGGPALVHGGPFGNIAHGCNSILATKAGMSLARNVITEAGFGLDLGGEKFLDIKCRAAGIWPRLGVLVATLRALKLHGGQPLGQVSQPAPEALRRGLEHLEKHLETLGTFGLPAVVALNAFPDDSDAEHAIVKAFCAERGVAVARHTGFSQGGAGSEELADVVSAALDATDAAPPRPRYLYELSDSLEDKVSAVAQKAYGAKGVRFTPAAQRDVAAIRAQGFGHLPVCMAKTHLSLTDDPTLIGRPRDFTITVREVRLRAGAGYVVPLTGDIMTMPGLPREPAASRVTVHPDGRVTGLMQGE